MKGVCDDEVAGHAAEMVKRIETFGDFCLAMVAALGGFSVSLPCLVRGRRVPVVSACVSVLIGHR